ncbi:MAG: hypothetical protein RL518_2087 [Pseudomonadota bacterium]|jgi:hypothetical protein
MSGRIGGSPESFSLSPLLALLPDGGNLYRLEALVSSLYARQEAVEELRDDAPDRENERKYAIEAAMLRQILEWLAERPGEAE